MPILDWMTRGEDVRAAAAVPYRLLEAVPMLDGGDADAANMLIQGDNLDALKALLPYYKGAVKCIYIDPPYNTRSAFEHYDDNLEHSQWLAMIYPRLVLLRELLAEDGSIWIQLDDNEAHYLRVIMDEVFGRRNFLADITWHKSYAVRSNAEFFSTAAEHIFAYSKDRRSVRVGKVRRSAEYAERFSNPDKDPRGPWQSVTMTISLMSGARGRSYARTGASPNIFTVRSPAGVEFDPPAGRCWSRLPDGFRALDEDGRIWWGSNGDRAPRLKMFLSEADSGQIPTTLWSDSDTFGFNEQGVRELRELDLNFSTPKPERLIRTVIGLASNPGDLVLDSFLGSGTTAAVAHKMGRRWIGIEMGDHAETHCKPRLDKVIAGEQGGVSEAVGWTGGGGYRYYRLGAPVFEADGHIADGIRFATLAAHIWFSETGTPFIGAADTPMLGVHDGMAYALLYNGILGDRSVSGGNVLTAALLERLRAESGWDGPMTVYGEWSKLGAARLAEAQVVFKQTPYDVKAR
ncbi:DNA methylase [Sphingomonas sanguinis]|uniref:site-specific DNA-methyltransferase (adenine-specific) n=2 Tax=Sphingomonas sanguinis TaxID=33051 RepID=A0A147J828_9SPHN|nr:site-specific DNA-methyltransferase [Sphingomonas sanguinis]KTW12631.1 DNA methylase [Sphingomonas sanguinis]